MSARRVSAPGPSWPGSVGGRGLRGLKAATGTPSGRRAAWPRGRVAAGSGVHGTSPRLRCPIPPSGPRLRLPRAPSPGPAGRGLTPRRSRHLHRRPAAGGGGEGGKLFLSSFLKAKDPVPPPHLRNPHLSCRLGSLPLCPAVNPPPRPPLRPRPRYNSESGDPLRPSSKPQYRTSGEILGEAASWSREPMIAILH